MHHHTYHNHNYQHHPHTHKISNQFNNRKNNEEQIKYRLPQANGYLKQSANSNNNNRFSDSIQRKNFNFNDETTDEISLCSSLSNSISSMTIYSLNDKNNSNSYSSFDDVTTFSSSSCSSSSSSSSSLSNSLSSSSSSLSSCVSSPVWTSALYSPCLHSNLFRSWSTNLLEIQQCSKQIDNGDYFYYTTDEASCSSNRGFSLSSYSLDSRNSKKIEDFLSNQSSENSLNESFTDYQNRSSSSSSSLTSYEMQDDENGQFLASYQEMNNKINDLLNCNENSKNLVSLKTRPEFLEIAKKTSKHNNRTNDFNNNIHVNITTTNEQDDSLSQSKSASPKPKFIAPRFEKKWLENQNNSMMNMNNHHYQQQPHFIEYSPKCQTFLKQINFNDNLKSLSTTKQHGLNKACNSYETNVKSNGININNNKKTYQKQANQYFKRSNNNLNNNKTNNNNNKYLNQKSMSKRFYQCKCLNNNKCTCYNSPTMTVINNTVPYTNENDFYLNRNIASYNNVNYNYIQAQNITNTTNTTTTTSTTTNTTNNNIPNNQNRFRYTAKSRA